jgi:hypothetical protein
VAVTDHDKPLEPASNDLLDAIARDIAIARFHDEERPLLGFDRYGTSPDEYHGPCPSCGAFPATITVSSDGLGHQCVAGCSVASMRAAIDRRLAASRAADALETAGEDFWVVDQLRQIAASPARRRV